MADTKLCVGAMTVHVHTNTYTNSVLLTALNFQGAVLLIQWISAQVHHAGSCRGDSKREKILSHVLIS